MWMEELTPCLPFSHDARVIAVGWLEGDRPHAVGCVERRVDDALAALCTDPWHPFAHAARVRFSRCGCISGAAVSSHPLRVLLWPPPEEANPYVRKLADALTQRGVRVRPGKRLADLCARPGEAQWLHVHWPEWMLHDPVRPRYLARIAYLRGLLALARAQGVRIAWTAHNLLGHDDPHPDLGALGRRVLLACCDLVLGHFAEVEPELRAWGFAGRFVVAPHPPFGDEHPAPFANGPARRALRLAAGVGDGDLLLVTPGALAPYKNLPALADALRALPDPSLRWWVMGRGEGATLRAMREAASRDPRITLREGFQSRDDLARALSASDAMLLGHKDFTTSGAAVLGATLGTPVIAPARAQLASWTTEGFFAPLDLARPNGLADALAQVRGMDPSVRVHARAFARRATWAQMAATLHAAMTEVP
jgi:glycosyltransferase involved in cell wall biosynthesis